MARRFVLKAEGRTVVAELLEREAPNLSRCLWESLPVEGFSVHAKFAGRELIVMLPFFAEGENEILEVKPGDIGYYPGRQTMCIFYGETVPFGRVSLFGRVVENLEALREVGDEVLKRGLVPVRLERAGG